MHKRSWEDYIPHFGIPLFAIAFIALGYFAYIADKEDQQWRKERAMQVQEAAEFKHACTLLDMVIMPDGKCVSKEDAEAWAKNKIQK